MSDALFVVSHLFSGWGDLFQPVRLEQALFLGLAKIELIITTASLLFLLFVHCIEKHGETRQLFSRKPLCLRWALYYVMVIGILLLSVSGSDKFIYFQF